MHEHCSMSDGWKLFLWERLTTLGVTAPALASGGLQGCLPRCTHLATSRRLAALPALCAGSS